MKGSVPPAVRWRGLVVETRYPLMSFEASGLRGPCFAEADQVVELADTGGCRRLLAEAPDPAAQTRPICEVSDGLLYLVSPIEFRKDDQGRPLSVSELWHWHSTSGVQTLLDATWPSSRRRMQWQDWTVEFGLQGRADRDPQFAVARHAVSGIERRIEGAFAQAIVHGERLLLRGDPFDVACVDHEFGLIWRVQRDKYVAFNPGLLKLHPVGDLVVGVAGPRNDADRELELLAIRVGDGQVAWRRVLTAGRSFAAYSLAVRDGVAYLAYAGNVCAVNVATGDVLFDRPTGLDQVGQYGETLFTPAAALPVRDQLLLVASSGLIQVRTCDAATVLQELQVPPPYFPVPRLLREWNGRVIFQLWRNSLAMNYCSEGLLILEPCDNGSEPLIAGPIRPAFAIATVEDAKHKHGFRLQMDHADIEELLRFAEIAVREVALDNAKFFWASRAKDPKFNGEIVLAVRGAGLSPPVRARLERMLARTQVQTAVAGARSGDGRAPIQFRLEAE